MRPWRPKGLATRTEARQLSSSDVDDFMAASDARPYEMLFESIEALLDELALLHPIQVARLRLGLRWLRTEAARRDLPWGKK